MGNVRMKRWLMAALWTAAASASYGVSCGAKAATHTVIIEAMRFTPETLSVNAGDTIVWVNKDPFPHTATDERKAFDSGAIDAGGSWKWVAGKRGTFAYYCTLHQTMKAGLAVR